MSSMLQNNKLKWQGLPLSWSFSDLEINISLGFRTVNHIGSDSGLAIVAQVIELKVTLQQLLSNLRFTLQVLPSYNLEKNDNEISSYINLTAFKSTILK